MSDAISEKEYNRLKSQVEDARESASEAKGALDQLKKRLQEEFGCETVEDANKLLKEMERKLDKAETEYQEAVKDYRNKWKPED
jgi:hypothetical protein